VRDAVTHGAPGGTVMHCSSPWVVTTQQKSLGAKAIMTTIPEPMGCRTCRMCGTFCLCTVGSPLRRPVLTKGRDLGPLSALG
jgi:hypothetical protein